VRWLGPGRKEDFETEKEALETRNTTLILDPSYHPKKRKIAKSSN
jgi:hypothetical protein